MRNSDWYGYNKRIPLTQWTDAGKLYRALLSDDGSKSLPAPKAGTHYTVIEQTKLSAYIAFPDETATAAQGIVGY